MSQYDENNRSDVPEEPQAPSRRRKKTVKTAASGDKYQGPFFVFMRKVTDPFHFRKKRLPDPADYPPGKAPLWVTDPEHYTKKPSGAARFFGGLGHFLLHTILILGMIGVVVLGVGAAVVYSFSDLELDERFASMDLDYSSFIYATNPTTGENYVYQEIQSLSGRRIWVSEAEIPQHVKDATVAVEDKRFYTHLGVDPIRTANAVIEYSMGLLKGSKSKAAGGSTLTQQVIKNMTGEDDYGIKRKVKEMLQALYIERRYDKDQILEYYLNTVFFGNSANGISAAADIYFGKDVSELTVVEGAAIISITKSPTYYDPVQNPENNRERRNTVLWMMYEQGYITRDEYDAYSNTELELVIGKDGAVTEESEKEDEEFLYNYYSDMVIEDVLADLQAAGYEKTEAERLLYRGGLQIYSCVDPDVQSMMEEYFANEENFKYSGYEKDVIVNEKGETEIPQISMMVMDPYTGDIIGVIGGRGEKDKSRSLNRATGTLRQPGSSIKPLSVYGYGVQNGLFGLGSPMDDVPVETRKSGSYKWPSNYSESYTGLVSMKKALSWSLNCPAAQGLQMIGVENSYNFMVNSLHFTTLVDTDKASLAPLSVGALTEGVTLREMVTAYTVFAGEGKFAHYRSYSKVVGYDGKTVLDNAVEREDVFSEQTAYLITDVLKAALDTGGSSDPADLYDKKKGIDIDTAGKSGTTSFFKDRWFIGYSPNYLAGVWWGYDTPSEMREKNTHHVTVWHEVMLKIHEMKAITKAEFRQPDNIVKVSVCWKSGMLPGAFCASDGCVQSFYYTKETRPTKTCTVHHQLNVCTASGRIAHEGCPSVTQKTFVDIERSFNCSVSVKDAGTVCPRLNASNILYNSDKLPVYTNMIPDGQVPGTSSNKANCICTVHTPAEKPHYNATGTATVVPPVSSEPATSTGTGTSTGTSTDTGNPSDTGSSTVTNTGTPTDTGTSGSGASSDGGNASDSGSGASQAANTDA